jgi:hypothetical protein
MDSTFTAPPMGEVHVSHPVVAAQVECEAARVECEAARVECEAAHVECEAAQVECESKRCNQLFTS